MSENNTDAVYELLGLIDGRADARIRPVMSLGRVVSYYPGEVQIQADDMIFKNKQILINSEIIHRKNGVYTTTDGEHPHRHEVIHSDRIKTGDEVLILYVSEDTICVVCKVVRA